MKPIDESSTLADLAKLREAYGITTMMITVAPKTATSATSAGRFCTIYGPVFDCATGQGTTEAEAIADAVRSIERMRSLATGGKPPGKARP